MHKPKKNKRKARKGHGSPVMRRIRDGRSLVGSSSFVGQIITKAQRAGDVEQKTSGTGNAQCCGCCANGPRGNQGSLGLRCDFQATLAMLGVGIHRIQSTASFQATFPWSVQAMVGWRTNYLSAEMKSQPSSNEKPMKVFWNKRNRWLKRWVLSNLHNCRSCFVEKIDRENLGFRPRVGTRWFKHTVFDSSLRLGFRYLAWLARLSHAAGSLHGAKSGVRRTPLFPDFHFSFFCSIQFNLMHGAFIYNSKNERRNSFIPT